MRQDPNEETPPAAIFPAEDRPNLDLPGADRHEPSPDPHGDPPDRLGDRIQREPAGIASDEPDLLPDIEVPDAQM